MRKAVFRMGWLCCLLNLFAISAYASAEETVIYIQESSFLDLDHMIGTMLICSRNDILSFGLAFLCSCTMIILAINLKKHRK